MVTALFPFARYDVSLPRSPRATLHESPSSDRWPVSSDLARTMPIDAWATDDEVVLTAAIPGVHPDNIEVTVLKNTITLRGTRPAAFKEQQGSRATWYINELAAGEFRRSIQFPFELDAEHADAQFHHGLIRIRVAKAQHAKPTRLSIRMEPAEQMESLESGEPIEA
jgi:HSP20 family protein